MKAMSYRNRDRRSPRERRAEKYAREQLLLRREAMLTAFAGHVESFSVLAFVFIASVSLTLFAAWQLGADLRWMSA